MKLALWLFFVPLCIISFDMNVLVMAGKGYCLSDHQSLLLQLKNDLNPQQSTKMVQWNQTADCCQWNGVTCNEGRVTGLDLSGESLSGGIANSSALFGLQYLQSLNLAYNNFRSAIPSEFRNLKNLRYLNLSNGGFRGQIPVELSQLTNLLSLDLSTPESDLKLENPNLLILIQNLTQITELYLDGVAIAGQGNEWCHALSSSLPNLQVLSLSRCKLHGPIDSSLGRLRSLAVIRLSWNIFSSPMPEFFADFQNITILDLSGCQLQGRFPEKIFQREKLKYLDLSYNYDLRGSLIDFPQDGPLETLILKFTRFSGSLPNSVSNLRHLSTLDLYQCGLHGTLGSSLSNLTELAYLRLSKNNFTGPAPLFQVSKNLTYLDLSYNDLNGSIPPTYLQGLQNLDSIKLHHNSFSGSIPSSLANTSSGVQELDLSSNHFEGPIPTSLFQRTELKILDLSYNNLPIIDVSTSNSSFLSFPNLVSFSAASCGLKTFPQFLSNQSQLQYLDLSKNQIHAVVPQWIWNLHFLDLSQNLLTDWEKPLGDTSLLVLDLHSNQLLRLLPELVPTNQILYLDVSNNNIQGSIPESICNFPLGVLDLANNSFTGMIPKCLISMMGSLSVLNLQENKLSGTLDLDAPLESCNNLRTLDLNSNFLEGKLPKYLAKCSQLEVFDLGNNHIDDNFPCWLKSAVTLHVLILRSNKLHGPIECLNETTWPSIQIFDLASNNLNGKIPSSFHQTWKGMMVESVGKLNYDLHVEVNAYNRIYYQDKVSIIVKGQQMQLVKIITAFTSVDLSCNKFEGTIPEEFGELKALYILNLSQNAFWGHIPSSIGNLNNLESFDLSNNSLSGEIPTQLASLSFLSVLNLSFNRLVGRIPTSTQLQSFDKSSFKGNEGLCGPPVTQNCSGDGMPPPAAGRSHLDKKSLIDWSFISAELGFIFGIGILIVPLVLWKQWRLWYFKHIDDLLYRIFPQLDFVYQYHGGKMYRTLKWKPH